MRIKQLLNICCVTLLLATLGATADNNQAQAQEDEAGALAQPAPAREQKPSKGTDRGVDPQAEGQPQVLFFNALGSGQAIDVYRIRCTGPCTSCRADVADEGPFNDTNFKVCIIGSAPGVTGTQCRISPQGGLSAFATVFRNGAGFILAFVTISEANNAGFEEYSSLQQCFGFGGSVASFVRILNQ